MPIINMTIRRKKISSPATHLVCGNTDYQIAFNFDDEWSEYDTKTARFYHNGTYTDVVFTGYLCDVPKITNSDYIEVGVFAGDLRTTTPGRIECDRSILCRGGSPVEPHPDVYAQLMELLNSLVNFSVPPSTIAAAVEEYMAANPLKETDPTVPSWAKSPNKPGYTADEVGAISLEKLNQAAESILAQAKASGVFDGAPGKDGMDGTDGADGATGPAGDRGLAIYRASKIWQDWSSEFFDFSDLQLPAGYVPKVNDLVITSNNYLCWVYEVNEARQEVLVASFMPTVNLNGGQGPVGPVGQDGDTPYIGNNGNWWIGDTDTGVSAGGNGSGGGGLVVVYDTGDGTANYSVSEINEFVSRGNRVVYRRYIDAGNTNNFSEYALTVLNAPSNLARFSFGDAGELDGYKVVTHNEVYIFDRTIVNASKASKIPNKVSDLENDVPFVAAPATASVGQTIVVSEVDEDGKPTKWEAVNISSGGPVEPAVSAEPAEDDIPKVFFGGPLQQTKDEVVVPFRYISKTEDVSGYAEIKAQGNSSMSYPKKNQTVKLFKDSACEEKLKVDFKGWGKQNKHVYKANWIDLTHARNVVSARLWADVVKSRPNYEELPELLRTSPNQGAMDGFPIKVYADGVYQGRYTLNIPKDKWAFNMDDDLDVHCVLCGENYVSGCFRAAAVINETDWTDEIHDTVPASIKTRWNEVIGFVRNSTDEEFKANLGNYFFVDSLVDYYLFGLASCGLDAFGKNQIYMTYDGQMWIASMYDMDSTWGLYWDGSKFVSTSYGRNEFEDMTLDREGNLLYMRLEALFLPEIQARWNALKEGPLSIENIINRFERFTDIAPDELVKEDYASTTGGGGFTNIPSKNTNNIQQIRAYALARQAWTDRYVANPSNEPDTPDEPDVPAEGVLWENYTPSGVFSTNANIDWDNQYIEASIDLTNCNNTNENLLGIGDSIGTWYGYKFHLLFVDNSTLQICANAGESAIYTRRCNIAITAENRTDFVVRFDRYGMTVNGVRLRGTDFNLADNVAASSTIYDDLVAHLTANDVVQIGSVEGNTRSNATYKYIKVVTGEPDESDAPDAPDVPDVPVLLDNGTYQFYNFDGSYITIENGNRITANIEANSNICISDLSHNLGDSIDSTNVMGSTFTEKILSLKNGDKVRTVVSTTGVSTNYSFFFITKTGAKDFSSNTMNLFTATVDVDVFGVGLWVKDRLTDAVFEIELYINDIRFV